MQDVERRESQGHGRHPFHPEGLPDQAVAEPEKEPRVGHQGDEIKKVGLRRIGQMVDEHHRGKESEEGSQERHHHGKVRDFVVAFDSGSEEAVGKDETEVVEQMPVLAQGDAEDPYAENQHIA